jgi:hypothetical protein
VPLERDAWIAEEPGGSTVLRAVLARASRQPFRMLALALVATALLLGARLVARPSFVGTLTLRLVEGDLQDVRGAPRVPVNIRDYISDVALNRRQILQLMEKHGLSERFRASNPVAAADALREEIGISVVRNYFLLDREFGDAARSASVVLSFTSGRREQALAVVHDIGALLLESQAASRSARLDLARKASAAELAFVQEQLQSLEARRARLVLAKRGRSREQVIQARAEEALVLQQMRAVSLRNGDLLKRAADTELALEAEQSQLGLSFQLVDESVEEIRPPLGAGATSFRAALFLVALLPISGILLGAFDRRVHRGRDVTDRGLLLLGVIPRWDLGAGGSSRAGSGGAPAAEASPP